MEELQAIISNDEIKRCYAILRDGLELHNIMIDLVSDTSPIASLIYIIHYGESDIKRMVDYFKSEVVFHMETIMDLKHYGIDPYMHIYTEIKNDYLWKYGESIIIKNRDRSIDDILNI